MSADPHGATDTDLRGRWLLIARATWLALVALTLGVFVASSPARFAQRQTDDIAIEVALLLIYALIAAVIFWRKSDDWMALFVSLFLVMFGATLSPSWDTLVESEPSWRLPVSLLRSLGPFSLLLFLYLFPDGHFVPWWTRTLTVVLIALTVVAKPFGPLTLPDPLSFLFWIGFLGAGVVAQIYRYRRVSGPVQRQQTKWVLFGVTAMSLGLLGAALPGELFPSLHQPGAQQALYELVSGSVSVLSLLLLPLSIGIAILRYRLFEIDLLINRTLVYGALTASVVALYVLVVGTLGMLFQASGNIILSLIATALIAVLFQPLRERLQRGVNRLMHGERDDPYAVLSRLGQRLEATLASEAVLPTIVETVAQALKLPYTAIALTTADHGQQTAATYPPSAVGGHPSDVVRLPLVYQNEAVGQLLLAPRAPGDVFTSADRRLLNDLAHQVGVAAHAVRLTADLQRLTSDLQRSRERLVTAREEERRRLRRDLHDGLAPTLAALALTASNVGDLIPTDPAAATLLANELQTEIRAAVADIRRLVYELRPPTLDELGLVAAIRERATQASHQSRLGSDAAEGLRVIVEAPDRLPPLPAAVEVAAYRIAQEALTNVVRHAQAHTCVIRLSLDEVGNHKGLPLLQVEITDDGVGLASAHPMGVGLLSMRERAAELGGSCVIERMDGAGTRVCTRLPILKE